MQQTREITVGAWRDVIKIPGIARLIVYSIGVFALLRATIVNFFHPALAGAGVPVHFYGTVLAVVNVVGALAAVITLPLARPMRVAWQCYWLYENGVREQAEVLNKLENATFALRITEGPRAGKACTADTSLAIFDATELGDVLDVVRLDSKPG